MDNWDEIRTAFQVARMGTVSGAADMLGQCHAGKIHGAEPASFHHQPPQKVRGRGGGRPVAVTGGNAAHHPHAHGDERL